MKSATSIITDYVLDKLPAEPVPRRIQLTRALAALEPDAKQAGGLRSIAAGLERIERQQRKLTFSFRNRR